MAEPEALSEAEEIEALLAWHATGRLTPEDAARVERHLAASPEAARSLARIRAELQATVETAVAAGGPGPNVLDRLMREVDPAARAAAAARGAVSASSLRPGGGTAAIDRINGLLEAIADWLTGLTRPQLGAMAASVAALLALQMGSLVYLSGDAGERAVRTYETASGSSGAGAQANGAQPAQGTFAIVAFKPGATAAEITRLLEATGAEIVEGPKAGIWRVRLSRETKSKAEAEALLARLRAAPGIVGFGALAL